MLIFITVCCAILIIRKYKRYYKTPHLKIENNNSHCIMFRVIFAVKLDESLKQASF